jgi:predicted DNA-binding transcriptional regulator AlpA
MSTRRLIAHDDLKFKGFRYSKVHLSRLEKQKRFPMRVPLGFARYGYVEEEIDQYIQSLIAARDSASEAP